MDFKRFDAFIVDLDETVLPLFESLDAYLATLYRELEEVTPLSRAGLENVFAKMFREKGLIIPGQQLDGSPEFKALAAPDKPSKKYGQAVGIARVAFNATIQPIPDVAALFRDLKEKTGKPLIMYSAAPAYHCWHKLRKTRLLDLFDHHYTAPNAPTENESRAKARNIEKHFPRLTVLKVRPKYDPDSYARICADFDVDPARTASIGNNAVFDLFPAQQLGATGIRVDWYTDRLAKMDLPALTGLFPHPNKPVHRGLKPGAWPFEPDAIFATPSEMRRHLLERPPQLRQSGSMIIEP
ncbi:MAG: HAD family hydrolase [Pseudomonadota bacterium]|nr:HAD family hydrolase [Pseudomonadota bacterium]